MILFEDRASTVLHKVLEKLPMKKKFLLPLNICPVVPDTFSKAGISFEFIDINLKTLCMDEELILQKIKDDLTVDGILFVKTFGINIDTKTIFQTIKSLNKNIFIIDDMCPCIQEFDYDIDNSYADMALFSSGYSKFVDIGYGGYGFLKDGHFKNIFEDKSQSLDFLNYKNKILEQIPLVKQHKSELNNIYKNNLPKSIHLGEQFNTWRFSILVNNKEEILESIFQTDGLFASSHYPQIDYNYLINCMPNSNTQNIHKKIINLFNDFRFDKDKAYRVVDIINKHLK